MGKGSYDEKHASKVVSVELIRRKKFASTLLGFLAGLGMEWGPGTLKGWRRVIHWMIKGAEVQ